MEHGLVDEPAHELAPRQLEQRPRRVGRKTETLVGGDGAAEVRDRVVDGRARLPLARAAAPGEPGRHVEARQLEALADREKDAARFAEAVLADGQVAVLHSDETEEAERAGLLDPVAEAACDGERAFTVSLRGLSLAHSELDVAQTPDDFDGEIRIGRELIGERERRLELGARFGQLIAVSVKVTEAFASENRLAREAPVEGDGERLAEQVLGAREVAALPSQIAHAEEGARLAARVPDLGVHLKRPAVVLLGQIPLAHLLMDDAEVVHVRRRVVEQSRPRADPKRLLEEPRRPLEAAVILVEEPEAVVRGRHARVVARAAVRRDGALEVLARRIPVAGPKRDDPEDHLGPTDVQIQRRLAEEPVGERRGALRGAVAAPLEQQEREARGQATRLLPSDVGAEPLVEVVERVDRFVQVAAMAEALDDLSADSEQGFGVLR